MKNPIYIIFIGIVIALMGTGSDEGYIVPNSLKLIVGVGIIAYGVYLFLNKRGSTQSTPKTNSIKGFRVSYIYIIAGIFIGKVVLNNESITSLIGMDSDIGNIIILIVCLSLLAYGTVQFFREKKEINNR